MINLDDFTEDAEYVIFDDFSEDMKYLPHWKCWFGAQKTFTTTDKYRKKRTINWGKPMIWLCNRIPDYPDPYWATENVVQISLSNKLY